MGSATYACPKCDKSIKVRRGNSRDSARYAEFLAQRGDLCEECRLAEFRAQHDAKVAAASVDPLNASLPALVGTEKQVAWALALRLEALPKIEQALQALLATVADHDDLSDAARQEMRDAMHLIAQERRERDDARAWIDTRDERIQDSLWSALQKRASTLCPTAMAEEAALRARENG